MNVPSLIKDPPRHRHSLALPYFVSNVHSILDVGGISFHKRKNRWIRYLGAPKEVWGVTHFADKKTEKPRIFTINVTRDYERYDRKPDMYYDGQHIPFPDSSYDIVTSIDVLEHMSIDERSQVITEMIRVSKQKVIIVFPFYSHENKKMEEEILNDMKNKGIQPKPSLTEHRHYELPKITDIENIILKTKYSYEVSYGTPRSIMRKYYIFQNSINSLLHIPGITKEKVAAFLKIIMETTGNVFNLPKNIEKKDAYRAIISITK